MRNYKNEYWEAQVHIDTLERENGKLKRLVEFIRRVLRRYEIV